MSCNALPCQLFEVQVCANNLASCVSEILQNFGKFCQAEKLLRHYMDSVVPNESPTWSAKIYIPSLSSQKLCLALPKTSAVLLPFYFYNSLLLSCYLSKNNLLKCEEWVNRKYMRWCCVKVWVCDQIKAKANPVPTTKQTHCHTASQRPPYHYLPPNASTPYDNEMLPMGERKYNEEEEKRKKNSKIAKGARWETLWVKPRHRAATLPETQI